MSSMSQPEYKNNLKTMLDAYRSVAMLYSGESVLPDVCPHKVNRNP